MDHLIAIRQFTDLLNKSEKQREYDAHIKRLRRLSGITEPATKPNLYAVQITLELPSKGSELLLEHETYQKFQKTNNRFSYHPENPSIPVKAHYHVYPSNSKKELYAVNVDDGKAHHRKNRGHVVPKKEADELRSYGVQISPTNILESRQLTINEGVTDQYVSLFIILEE